MEAKSLGPLYSWFESIFEVNSADNEFSNNTTRSTISDNCTSDLKHKSSKELELDSVTELDTLNFE
jgi:hypothetical protein